MYIFIFLLFAFILSMCESGFNFFFSMQQRETSWEFGLLSPFFLFCFVSSKITLMVIFLFMLAGTCPVFANGHEASISMCLRTDSLKGCTKNAPNLILVLNPAEDETEQSCRVKPNVFFVSKLGVNRRQQRHNQAHV